MEDIFTVTYGFKITKPLLLRKVKGLVSDMQYDMIKAALKQKSDVSLIKVISEDDFDNKDFVKGFKDALLIAK